jgi:hypothetical protein
VATNAFSLNVLQNQYPFLPAFLRRQTASREVSSGVQHVKFNAGVADLLSGLQALTRDAILGLDEFAKEHADLSMRAVRESFLSTLYDSYPNELPTALYDVLEQVPAQIAWSGARIALSKFNNSIRSKTGLAKRYAISLKDITADDRQGDAAAFYVQLLQSYVLRRDLKAQHILLKLVLQAPPGAMEQVKEVILATMSAKALSALANDDIIIGLGLSLQLDATGTGLRRPTSQLLPPALLAQRLDTTAPPSWSGVFVVEMDNPEVSTKEERLSCSLHMSDATRHCPTAAKFEFPNLKSLLPKTICIPFTSTKAYVAMDAAIDLLGGSEFTLAEGIALLSLRCCNNGLCVMCNTVSDALAIEDEALRLTYKNAVLVIMRDDVVVPPKLSNKYRNSLRTDGGCNLIVAIKYKPMKNSYPQLVVGRDVLEILNHGALSSRHVLHRGMKVLQVMAQSQSVHLGAALPLIQDLIVTCLLLSKSGRKYNVLLPVTYETLTRCFAVATQFTDSVASDLLRPVALQVLEVLHRLKVSTEQAAEAMATVDDAVMLVLTLAINARTALTSKAQALVIAIVQVLRQHIASVCAQAHSTDARFYPSASDGHAARFRGSCSRRGVP